MSTIVTRAGKGSPLTNTEVDANFTNLNTDKVQVTGAPTSGQAIIWNGTAWVPGASASYPAAGIANSTGSAWGTSYSTTGSGTVVALATSPTLTTPVITALDTQFTLQDNVDPTKQAQFELSAITTATTGTYTLPAATTTLAGLGTVQTFTANQTFAGTTYTFSGNVSMTSSAFTRTATTQAWTDGSMTTAAWTVGGTAQTGIITLGRSTAAQTLNIATGATATATTKTINIGTAGLSGSTTAISIGSAVSGATTTTSAYGAWTFNSTISATALTSTIATGTAPFTVASTTQVANLNVATAGTATNIAAGTNLQIPYNTGAGSTSFIVAPTVTSTYLQYDGTGFAWATVAAGTSLSNDTSTASFVYPLFAAATSGTASTVYTGNAKLLYKPSTGEFQASELAASNGLVLNATTVAASYTIGTGYNAMSVGPVTVASGQAVTLSSGQRWLVM